MSKLPCCFFLKRHEEEHDPIVISPPRSPTRKAKSKLKTTMPPTESPPSPSGSPKKGKKKKVASPRKKQSKSPSPSRPAKSHPRSELLGEPHYNTEENFSADLSDKAAQMQRKSGSSSEYGNSSARGREKCCTTANCVEQLKVLLERERDQQQLQVSGNFESKT